VVTWGLGTDVPVPGDYDGDGKADLALYRPATATWFVWPSSGGTGWTIGFGIAGDTPVPRDYDGDVRMDIAVYRPSTGMWFVLTSSSGFTQGPWRVWGTPGDVPVPADYDGDGKADMAVYRPSTGTWLGLKSSTNNQQWWWTVWGLASDQPVPADYDGDGKADIAVYRPATAQWYVKPSSGAAGWTTFFGIAGDVPLGPLFGGGSATLAWDPHVESDIAGYVVSWGTQSGVYTALVDVGNRTSWTINNLQVGRVYYFAVQAYNKSGLYSAYSVEVSATIAVPTPPSGG